MRSIYLKYRNKEWAFQLAALVISAVVLHAVYTGVIRPTAEAALEVERAGGVAGSEDGADIGGRIAVVLKDYEQEACFIAAFWALFIMLFKWEEVRHSRRLFGVSGRRGQGNFLETQAGGVILPEPEDMQKYRSIFERVEQRGFGDGVLFRVVSSCLNRFFTTSKVADATDAMEQACLIESERLETGLGVVRYLVWVIPSLGFIGTVRGIGEALGRAEEAVQGNIAPVTESLGTAFNSTLIALAISVVIMFLLHKLQETQETLVLDTQRFCDEHVLRYLQEKTA